MLKNFLVVLTLFSFTTVDAQYFGRNKPRYESFDFKVLETQNFDIHYYTKDLDFVDKMGQYSEQWYDMHQECLHDTFTHNNPIIFYDNHADFQQTNTIGGSIGVGTGGVTEAFKNRVVMPYTFTNQQTHHVLGHEMVHAFQYHMIIGGDSTSLQNLRNVPLWMVEGLAEYMSIGRNDTYTAMWMRDAVLSKDVPDIKGLNTYKYFPYRYGQAFWTFLAGLYGDGVVKPFFMETAKYGFEVACRNILNSNEETIGKQYSEALKTYYDPYLGDKKERFIGRRILSAENSGKMNVSPSLSPNGKYVVFLSEKDVFSTDLFLADARSGKILNKISSSLKDGHLDAINYMESTGTWSPNSKQFAFIAVKKGGNVLIVKEALTGKTIAEHTIPEIPAMTNPTWSPDGKSIVVSGLKDGQTDLFQYTLKSKKVTQLTNTEYSEIHANFNNDGSQLVYATDERSFTEGRTNGRWTFDVAVLNVESLEQNILDVFHGADNLNPVFDHENNILFLSDRDGFRNMYKYNFASSETTQLTDFLTGISGITRYSPAIAASRIRDRVLFTHYYGGAYSIYESKVEKLLSEVVDPNDINFDAGKLPVLGLDVTDIVDRNILAMDEDELTNPETFYDADYKPRFKMDYATGGTGLAVGNNNNFGNYTGLQGGIGLLFGDMLGNHQMFVQASMNGEIQDVGGQVSYINRKHQLAWGASFSHIPLRTGGFLPNEIDTLVDNNNNAFEVLNAPYQILRVFDDQVSLFAHYPFSTTLRLEGSVAGSRRGFSLDKYNVYYQPVGGGFRFVGEDRENIDLMTDEIPLNNFYTIRRGFGASTGIALVGDNSFSGLTSPLAGHRFRIGFDRVIGNDDFYSSLVDLRKYFWKKPFSFAFRALSYLRFVNESNTVYPFYVGDMGNVRGYGSITSLGLINDLNLGFDQLLGSKMFLANAEIRIPFTGPRQLSLIPAKGFYSDLAFFIDSGVAFDEFEEIRSDEVNSAQIVTSVGVAMRINLFGALIVEPHYAWPLKKDVGGTFGINIIPGW